MASELSHSPDATTVDLTGLPESVVRQVKQIVDEARQKQANGATPPADSSKERPTLHGRFEHLGYSIPKEAIEQAQKEAWAPLFISRPKPSAEELERLLDELSSGPPGKVLPPDFSRADIYDDHD